LTCSFVPALVDDDDSDPADDNDPSVQDDTILNGFDQHVPSILGRLALVPVGETGTIPYARRPAALKEQPVIPSSMGLTEIDGGMSTLLP
jgi:hypothetical protein